MASQPNPEEKEDMLKGLHSIRETHIAVVEQTGMSCADEMLYPENYEYLSDILSYIAVGARSVENQQHRLTASGIEVPCGMKTQPAVTFRLCLIPSKQPSAATISSTASRK